MQQDENTQQNENGAKVARKGKWRSKTKVTQMMEKTSWKHHNTQDNNAAKNTPRKWCKNKQEDEKQLYQTVGLKGDLKNEQTEQNDGKTGRKVIKMWKSLTVTSRRWQKFIIYK